MNFPEKLSFLNDEYKLDDITTSWWLRSDFNAIIWEVNFSTLPQFINWEVRLSDGSALTDEQHSQTLKTLRSFLIVATRNCSERDQNSNAPITQQIQFRCALKIIDYILLNDAKFQLHKYGIEGLSTGDLKGILECFSSNKDTSESVYSWRQRLSSFCMDLLSKTTASKIDGVFLKHPEILIVTPDQEEQFNLCFPIELLPKVRACLHAAGLYRRPDHSEYRIHSVKISKIILSNTLYGCITQKPTALSLSFYANAEPFVREFDAAPVTTGVGIPMSYNIFRNYRRAMFSLAVLHDYNLPAPSLESLSEISQVKFEHSESGRFRTLPSPVVFCSIRNAIEFHLNHAEILKIAIRRLCIYCESRGKTVSTLTEETYAKLNAHQPEAVELGLTKLGLSARTSGQHHMVIKSTKNNYFNELRSNAGLIETLRVYIACVQVIVGTLCARRVGELIDLLLDECLDETKSWLIFLLRKSTKSLYGLRAETARPIPPIAVEMIESLIYIHGQLRKFGQRRMRSLFSSPHKSSFNFVEASAATFNRNLDLFCDYFQTPLDSLGRRYYVRQHQFRRFFALLFFKCSNIGGLDTLRWMLGHTDLHQVWHYITENIDGATIHEASAQHVAEAMIDPNYSNAYRNLAELIKLEYGVDAHSLVDTDDLESLILSLIKDDRIEVTPHIYTNGGRQHLKIIVIIKER